MLDNSNSSFLSRFKIGIIIALAFCLFFSGAAKAADAVLEPGIDISGGDYSFSDGLLIIGQGTTVASQTIRLGTTAFGNEGVISRIQIDGTLSFASSSSDYEAAQAPLNRYGGTSIEAYNGGYFGIIIPGGLNSNTPVSGNGTINIVPVDASDSESHPLVGLVAVQGAEGADAPNVNLNTLTLDASGSTVRQNYSNASEEGFVGIALGIAGNASVALGSSAEDGPMVKGAPAVMMGYGFAADDDFSGPEPTAGAASITVNSGTVTTEGITNANQFSAIKNFGQDTGVADITVNGGTVDGGKNGAGIYCANAVSDINLNGGVVTGFSGMSVRAGNIYMPQSSTARIIGAGGNMPIDSTIKVDKGNGSAIYFNSNRPSTVSFTGGVAKLNITNGVLLARYNSVIYAQGVSEDDTSPISRPGSVSITGGVFGSYFGTHEPVPIVNFNGAVGGDRSISGGSFNPYMETDAYLDAEFKFEIGGFIGYGQTVQDAENSLGQLNAFLIDEGLVSAPTEPDIVPITPSTGVDSIVISPSSINLSTVPGGANSAAVTAALTPAGAVGKVVWSIAPETVATITPGEGNTATVTAVAEGRAVITATVGTVSATAVVNVSNQPVIATDVVISANSPDHFSVRVQAEPNTAINQTGQVGQISMYTWSNLGQTDMDAKVATETSPGSGVFEATFPVNDTPVNNFYINAGDILINIYGSLEAGQNGGMIYCGSYNYLDGGFWQSEVAVTPYVQNIGFITPTVGSGAIAGTTGQGIPMEGIRLSTPIDGLDIEYNVHVQEVGWMNTVKSGAYAGTMGANLQMEAIHIALTGERASQYSVQYQAYVENIGWMDWVENGQEAGTVGAGLQMEALRVQIVPAGTPLPENNS